MRMCGGGYTIVGSEKVCGGPVSGSIAGSYICTLARRRGAEKEMCVCVCVCACVSVCVCVCACACVRVYVCADVYSAGERELEWN